MSKSLLILSSLLLFSTFLLGQSTDLSLFNEQRLLLNQRSMTVLGSWAVGNIALGSILQANQTGSSKYFHQMNAGWNVVNLTLAGFGIWGSMQTDPGSFSLMETINEQYKMQKILLFNGGLDVGYILGGLYLTERAKNSIGKRADQFKGFGRSIMLQGAFLLGFDIVTAIFHGNNNQKLEPLLSNLHFNGQQLGLLISF